MNTKRVNAAADVICRAMENGKRTPAGWAVALESTQMLMSPELAAEMEWLRRRVAELEQQLEQATAAGELAGAALVDQALDRLAVPEPLEDPHDSPLHHTYRIPRDLPPLDGMPWCG
ncbi:hypothetical protein [Streptomyces capoamus]|uniref:hypothetical protein n=1 Tax=Streptomyces capoamus TaxID=68183 RepID=UPI00339B1E03